MPPNGMISSAKPPIHRSTRFRPPRLLAYCPVPFRKASRSPMLGLASLPNTRSKAAARLASIVVAAVMVAWVP
ncbi:hypothetical protein D9M70_329380 [compost metagenome]